MGPRAKSKDFERCQYRVQAALRGDSLIANWHKRIIINGLAVIMHPVI
jgi:hypothetical protein